MATLVSVIIPTYNRVSLLARALESVVAQTIDNIEVIVIDDNSTDETQTLLIDFTTKYPFITSYINPNERGASSARNYGISKAQGKYIAFLDSDDEWMAHHLKTSLHYLETYPEQVDLVTANPLRVNQLTNEVYRYDEIELGLYDYSILEKGYLFKRETLLNTALSRRIMTTQTIVAKRQLLQQTSFNTDIIWGEDNMYILDLAALKPNVLHLQDYHVKYWAHEDNITNNIGQKDQDYIDEATIGMSKFYFTVLEKFSAEIKHNQEAKDRIANFIFWQLGYSVYCRRNEFESAISCFHKAMQLSPYKLRFYKTYIATQLKRLFK
ncbi:glycosyltransferase family 2 protein [Paraglaciecola sp. 2405UD69-4]|uniref:glycosyltransferase family 2 protein n=1 Tax=Paraglaciecola sp. 2405UD69-4 TaxID=3391836 RepID=UPI0039C9CE2D